MKSEWKRIKGVQQESWFHQKSGHRIYKGINGWWFVIPTEWHQTSWQQFGPYKDKEEAIQWSTEISNEAAGALRANDAELGRLAALRLIEDDE